MFYWGTLYVVYTSSVRRRGLPSQNIVSYLNRLSKHVLLNRDWSRKTDRTAPHLSCLCIITPWAYLQEVALPAAHGRYVAWPKKEPEAAKHQCDSSDTHPDAIPDARCRSIWKLSWSNALGKSSVLLPDWQGSADVQRGSRTRANKRHRNGCEWQYTKYFPLWLFV